MERILVQRANVILEVSSEDKARFMEQGYSVIDKNGGIVEEAIPTDVHELQKLVKELKTVIAAKDAEIEALTAEEPTSAPTKRGSKKSE